MLGIRNSPGVWVVFKCALHGSSARRAHELSCARTTPPENHVSAAEEAIYKAI